MDVGRYAKYAARMCVGCGNCVDICPSYIATGDLDNSPMGRIGMLRRGAGLAELYKSFYSCTMCKRCAYFCPLGLDVAEVTRQVRDFLAKSGLRHPYVEKVVNNFVNRGNNIGMPPKVVEMSVRASLKKIEKEKGAAPRVYLHDGVRYIDGVTGAEQRPGGRVALLFPSSSDIFEFDLALRGYLYLLNRLGFDVVISLKVPDTANYGYFLDNASMYKIADMYLAEISRVSPHVVVFGECGHGWHVFASLVLPRSPAPALHIHQLLHRAYTKGVLRLERVEVRKPVLYMDPCNYSRGVAPLIEEPRILLRAVVGEYIELWDSPRKSLCCLGGGGLIAPETLNTAVEYWKRFDIKGVGTVVRPCATCKAQLKRVFNALGVDVDVTGVVELVYRAAR